MTVFEGVPVALLDDVQEDFEQRKRWGKMQAMAANGGAPVFRSSRSTIRQRIYPGMPVCAGGVVIGRVEHVEFHTFGDGSAGYTYQWRAIAHHLDALMRPRRPPRCPPRGGARRSRQARSSRPRALRRAIARGADPRWVELEYLAHGGRVVAP